MPTPTNSVFNRDVSDEARMAQLVYDNESLKIEVDTLREQLESSGALNIEDLRAENEKLRLEATEMRVELGARTTQLDALRNSDSRFTNIDDSLKLLLAQIQSQRDELTELRLSGKGKDDKIIELRVFMERAETAAAEAEQRSEEVRGRCAELTTALAAATATAAEADTNSAGAALAAQSMRAEHAAAVADLEARLAARDARLAQSEADLLAMKEAAAAASTLRGTRATTQEQTIADLRAAEVTAQERSMALETALARAEGGIAGLRQERSQLISTHEATVTRARWEKDVVVAAAAEAAAEAEAAKATVHTAATATATADYYSPEVKAHVEKKVRAAVADRDRRLQEQVDQNASLLSRMSLLQHETELAVKSASLAPRNVEAVNDRVAAVSKARDARSAMGRRVADFLAAEQFSKESVQTLLQDMLDYQERTEEDISTRLLIKDIQAEEGEKTFRWNLKRLENENASLLKQLQMASFAAMQRETQANHTNNAATMGAGARTGNDRSPRTTDANHDNNITPPRPPPQAPAPPAVAAAAAAAGVRGSFSLSDDAASQRPSTGEELMYTPTQHNTHSNNNMNPTQYHQQQQQQPPRSQYGDPNAGGVYGSPIAAAATAAAVSMIQTIPLRPIARPTPTAAATSGVTVAAPDACRIVIVHCPACTYEQRFGNVRCEICETPLVLPPQRRQ